MATRIGFRPALAADYGPAWAWNDATTGGVFSTVSEPFKVVAPGDTIVGGFAWDGRRSWS